MANVLYHRKRESLRFWLGVVAVSLVAGCAGSPQPRYYTLDMTPSGSVNPECNVAIERLRPHDALTRVDILVMKTPTQIEYYAFDRWAASLSELVSDKLRSELGGHDPNRETVVVSGDILAFEQVDRDDGADAHIKLDLSFRKEGASRYSPALLRKRYEISVPAEAARPAAVVEVLSAGLETIAAEIATDASRIARADG
jgi:uncharacterized lipoprotein YmbA